MEGSAANIAVQVLEQKIEEIDREAEAQKAELRANIARLQGRDGAAAPQLKTALPPVHPGQFSGMRRSAALLAYLNERPGGVLVTKANIDLVKGGAPMGKDPSRSLRYLRVTITQNPKTFRHDKESDTVSLVRESSPQQRRTG